MNRSQQLIKQLELIPHPEGGYFKETYRSKDVIINLPKQFEGERNYSTSIYFLLESKDFSAFHKINQDELWYFHEGSPIKIHKISPEGEYSFVILGSDVLNNQQFQHVVPADYWFAATVENTNSYSFVGCNVAPGFDFKDFVLATKQELISLFPNHTSIINQLTQS